MVKQPRLRAKKEPALTILAEDGFVEWGPMGVMGSCYWRFYTDSDGEGTVRFIARSGIFSENECSMGEQLCIRGNTEGEDISADIEVTIAATAAYAEKTVRVHLGTHIGKQADPTINPYYEILEA